MGKPKGRKSSTSNRPEQTDQGRPQASLLKQINDLYGLRTTELRERFQSLFSGVHAPSNKDFLIRRIAHKLQEDAFGGLSKAAEARLDELKADMNPIAELGQRSASKGETTSRRVPIPGTVITKTYKGKEIEVRVLPKGFEYKGKPYRSLSRIAFEVTGVHQSGFVFFRL